MADGASFAESFSRIDALLESPAAKLVRAFYDRDFASRHSNKADFVGELFTTLGESDPDCFEASDLVAVHLMGMSFTPTTVRALLDPGEEREAASHLLSEIPNVDIWDNEADFTAANELWRLLVEREGAYPGVGWVKAGKLLARKRPGLIPVVDEVITRLVPGPPDGYWSLFQLFLRDPASLQKVEDLRPDGLDRESTPTLRLLDTVLWMRGSGGPAKDIRLSLGFSD